MTDDTAIRKDWQLEFIREQLVPLFGKGALMSCKACQADKKRVFNGEIALHFPGLKGLDMPIVWVFPKLMVCLECGFAEFEIPERELHILQESDFTAA